MKSSILLITKLQGHKHCITNREESGVGHRHWLHQPKTSHWGRAEGKQEIPGPPVKETGTFKTSVHSGSHATPHSTRTWQVLKLKHQPQDIYGQAVGSGLPGTVTNRSNYLSCMFKPVERSLSRSEQFGIASPHDKFFHTARHVGRCKSRMPILVQIGRQGPSLAQQRLP